MSFYEVIYETPGVDEVRAGKKSMYFQTCGDQRREDLNFDGCLLHCWKLGPPSLDKQSG
jgi:hypothetical protein